MSNTNTTHTIIARILAMLSMLFIGFFSRSIYINHTKLDEQSTQVFFTPQDDCEQQIVYVINNTQKQILIQAYGFTSTAIGQALAKALERGVVVRILLDKSNVKAVNKKPITSQERATAKILRNLKNAEVIIDYMPGIAHNKIIIADDVVITGSFNFTMSAQRRNAENIMIISNQDIAKIYAKNWHKRYKQSITSKQPLHEHNHLADKDDIDNNDVIFG